MSKIRSSLFEEKYRVTRSVTAPDDTNVSDATDGYHVCLHGMHVVAKVLGDTAASRNSLCVEGDGIET